MASMHPVISNVYGFLYLAHMQLVFPVDSKMVVEMYGKQNIGYLKGSKSEMHTTAKIYLVLKLLMCMQLGKHYL